MFRRVIAVVTACLMLALGAASVYAQCSGGAGAQSGLSSVSCSGVPAWSGSSSYASGAQVTYGGCLYKANQGISANAAWCPGCAGVYLYGNGSACPTAGCNYGAQGVCSGSATPTPTQPSGCTPTTIVPYVQVNGGTWSQTSSVTVSAGSSVKFGPQPTSGGSWSWSTGATSREITITASSSASYTATYTNSSGCKSTQTFTVTVSGSTGCTPTTIVPYVQVNGGSWSQTASVTVSAGSSVKFGPQPTTGGSWSWSTGSTSREITITANSSASYTATYTNSSGCKSTQTFNVTVSSSTPTPCTNCGGGNARVAPYADISLGAGSQVASNVQTAGLPGVTLAFLVDGGCTATWGGGLGSVSNAMFPNGTSVKSAIDNLTNAGKKVIISWGGANGSIASSCSSASAIQSMYQSVFNAYPNIAGQDFDIEGGINTSAVAQALAGLKAANPNKAISLTLPVLPSGLVSAGLSIVNACHSAGFHPDTINVMAMDYGSANDNGGNMLLSAEQAAQATRSQTGDNIGITPMIGVNDTTSEVFTLSNASSLVSWARGQGYVNRLAFWSLGRDNGSCAGQTTWASATCSGLSQSNWQFSGIFAGF